jgi:tetratricopeptide (TPR) repeat protein
LGEFDEAEKNYTDSLALYKKTYGDKHTSVADAFNNIGIVRRKKGDYTGAIKYYEKAYNIKEKVFGENNLGGALILSNIGLAHRKQDN